MNLDVVPPRPDAGSVTDPVADLVRTFAAQRSGPVAADAPLAAVWQGLVAAGDPAPGLSFAEWAAPAAIGGPLTPLLANSPDLAFLLETLRRFHPLFGRDRVELTTRGGRAMIGLRSASGEPALPDTVDACFALLCRVIRHLTRTPVTPARVLLRRAGPQRPSRYREVFGDPQFEAARDQCEFDPAVLSTPIPGADPVVLRILQPYAERQVAVHGRRWTTAVTRTLTAAARERPPRLPEVARTLAVSERSLQQRLQAEDTTFSALFDLVQRERALAMLAAGDQLLTTIAVGVGFSTPAGLTRAVRRWTGMTPTQYRNQPPVGSLKPAP